MATNDDSRAQAIAASILSKTKEIATPITPNEYPSFIYEEINEKTGDVKICIDFAQYADFLKNEFSIIYFNKTLYIYDNGKNIYRPQTNEIETHIRDTFVKWNVTSRLQSVLLEMKAHLTSMGCYSEYPFNTSVDTIPVENGIVKLNFDDGVITLLPHHPCHLFTYKLSVIYNPNIKNCHAIELLKRMVDPGLIKTLIQIPAQSILQMQTGHAYKKAYILQGEPHAGKTSYLKLLYSVFGNDFTTSISLQQLCSDRFVGGNLEGKLLNIYDDLEDVALEVIDQFKTFTGDCRHGIERKYEGKYTGKVTAVHIFTCNYPPEYPEKVMRDAAFWTRWEYVKFPFEYAVNPNFYTEWYTKDRISSFFNLVLSAIIYIKKRGLLSNSEVQDVMLNWSINSDPLYDFINSVFRPQDHTTPYHFSKKKFHDLYKKWCKDNNIPEHKIKSTMKSFTTSLQAHDIIPNKIQEGGRRYETYSTLNYAPHINVTPAIDLDYRESLSQY